MMTEQMESMTVDENIITDFDKDKITDSSCSLRHTVDDVNKLPFEDTIWFIELSVNISDDDNDDDNGDNDDESIKHVLTISDRQNAVIYKCCMYNSVNNEQCKDILMHCMFNPLTGVARRPIKVICKHSSSSCLDLKLDLSDIGITYINGDYKTCVDHSQLLMRSCNGCRLRGTSGLFIKCGSCNAMLYCSNECQVEDWSLDGELSPFSHKLWCTKMAMYMSDIDKLNDLPFTFTDETTSHTFTETRYIEFLKSYGIYDQGGWRTEITKQYPVTYGEQTDDDDDIIVLPVESCILDDPILTISDIQYTWMSYYSTRGFRLDSPIAILLQWPLTLFYIIKHCLPNDYPNWYDKFDGKHLLVDIVGVEKEVELLLLFKELGYLLPDLYLDIQMYGREISPKIHGHVYEVNNVKITVCKGLYHKISTTARTPNIVIGFNAGLAVYKQWSQTLVKFRSQLVPAYFTDYCEYSCECSRSTVEGLGIGTISDCIINPFRSPVRKQSAENDLPLYSNGFIYHLKYPP